HTLLNAKDLSISINTRAFLRGAININHVEISNASIDLYTDSTGYSNTSVFNKGAKKDSAHTTNSASSTELEKFSLVNVGFTVDDQKAEKLFSFTVNNINGKMTYPDSGWYADFHLDVTAKSMAFKTTNGSFIKNKPLEGDFTAGYNSKSGRITVNTDELDIGDDPFKIDAVFETGKTPATFVIHVASDHILWRSASALVADNIQQKLGQFDISKPIAVTATISGNFKGPGDPLLYVTAGVKDSQVHTPGIDIENCSFDCVFTNNYEHGKGLSDDNSVIRLVKLTGTYNHLPFTIDTGSIINLNNPIATGNFRAKFPVADLNDILGKKVARFTRGTAEMNLRYKADIVQYELNKPVVAGMISLRNTDFRYIPDNLSLTNSSVILNITGNDLVLENIRLQSGRSVVLMNGRVNNFMNLYYSAPEKIVANLQISSPHLYLGEFLAFLSGGNVNGNKTPVPTTGNSSNVIDQLSISLQKGSVAMHLDAANVYYLKFLATDAHADLLTSEQGVVIKNVGLKHAGGFLRLSGSLQKGDDFNHLSLKTTVSHVDVKEFFKAFSNFGLTDFTADNLQGFLSAKTQITAGITDKGQLVPQSVNGALDVNLQQGALIDFKAIGAIAKFAFPFRHLSNISIPQLDAHFDVHGNMITIHPMKLSSSALNMDIAGEYGINGKGTDIVLDIPVRNPKNDTTIHDEQKLLKKRYKGIVLHILAKSDSTGKLKIGWNKERKKD
ncbi:MAG: AsmA-like C-terminal region-containing protein, partial [Mucilaginibacter sp.]